MKSSRLKYLALLGLLGILGVVTDNTGFLGFFGFFGFASYTRLLNDERLEGNINRSARNAFFVTLPVFVLATVIAGLMRDLTVYAYAVISLFILQLLTFSFSLRIYDRS